MTVGPRIVFTRFASPDSPKSLRWQEHVTRVTGQAPKVIAKARGPENGVVVWSLVSGNNRELARSARVYGRFDDAVDEAGDTVDAPAVLEAQLVNDRVLGGYGWFLVRPGGTDVVCSRWYDSDRDRRAALRAAIASLAVASLVLGARAPLATVSVGDR